jgi:hypothetical protein
MKIDRVCDQGVPNMGIGEQGNLDLERDHSGGDIVGTCKGNRDMQERGSCTAAHATGRRRLREVERCKRVR